MQREHDLKDFEVFEITLDSGSSLVPTWLHFESDFGCPGRVLAPLGASWKHLGGIWGHLGASWGLLARLGSVLGVFEASWPNLAFKKNTVLAMEREARLIEESFA